MPVYRLYVLTAWREHGQSNGHASEWHFSLIDPHTGQQHGFASAEALLLLVEQFSNRPLAEQKVR